ncbi:MAG: hypothetical protein JXQ73_09595, partial [Phycisphaerae bacterium]|nr:hypothetical protein [Phycisphaerae bacterium]
MISVVVTVASVSDTFAYDALGRMTSAVRNVSGNPQSAVSFTYDPLGRLDTEAIDIGGFAKTIDYAYDNADRRTGMSLLGESLAFTYEYFTGSAQTRYIKRNDVAVAEYAYKGPAVKQRSVYPNTDPNVAVVWDVARDGHLRMTASRNLRADAADPNALLLAGFDYVRSAMGIPTRETFSRLPDPNA